MTPLKKALEHEKLVTASIDAIYAAAYTVSYTHLLMDMKALNLQNRTFAIIENGSWAVKSGDLMQKFVNDELKNLSLIHISK